MMRDIPSWEELNAYVDGELAAEDAARVALAVADSPELAEDVARLAQIKAIVGTDDSAIPEFVLPAGKRRHWSLAIAATVVVIVGASVLAFLALTGPLADDSAVQLTRARIMHQDWAVRTAGAKVDDVPASAYLTAGREFGFRVHVPDLSAARLRVVRVAPMAAKGDLPAALHVGYAGTRGCRVSLWISPATKAMREAPTLRRDGIRDAYLWRVEGLGYTILASGMDRGRLAVIVQAAYTATRTFRPPQAEMRTALRRSRDTSAPCKG